MNLINYLIYRLINLTRKPDTSLGYIEYTPKRDDYMLGTAPVKDNVMMDGNWDKYMPTGEVQKRNDQDKMACVTFSALSCIEAIFTYQIERGDISKQGQEWLRQNGYIDSNGKINFSDRFVALLSGTSYSGNSFDRVAEAIRKYGLIPESLHPYDKDMAWSEYYNASKITDKMRDLGQEFLKKFTINYVFIPRWKWSMVWVDNFKQELRHAPLQVGVHAWNGVKNGVYVKTNNTINHGSVLSRKEWNDFDSYEVNGSFFKQLAADFIFHNNAVKYIINENKNMSNVKVVRVKGKNTIGFFVPANSPNALMSLSANYGIVIPGVYPDKVDWDKLDLDGEVELN